MALHLRVMDNIEHAWGFSCCIGLTRMQILLSAIGHTPPTEPAKQATVEQPGYFSKKKEKDPLLLETPMHSNPIFAKA